MLIMKVMSDFYYNRLSTLSELSMKTMSLVIAKLYVKC